MTETAVHSLMIIPANGIPRRSIAAWNGNYAAAACPVPPDCKGPRDRRDPPGHRGLSGHGDHKVFPVPEVLLVLRVLPVQLGLPGRKV